MNIIAVDDERFALQDLCQAIEEATAEAPQAAALSPFSNCQSAMEHAASHPVDVAFLDIHMGSGNGLDLAIRLKQLHPHINIIFVTGHANYMESAFSLYASGYVLKPVTAARVRRELENLRAPTTPANAQRVRITTFGSFQVFIDDIPLHITRAKARELLAYLVHKRGAGISAATIAAVLWEDKPYTRSLQKQVQTVVSQLGQVLREAGIEDILAKGWNNLSIDTAKVSCDLYDFAAGKREAIIAYMGEYMTDYSWGEAMTGYLSQAKDGLLS